MEYHPSHAEQLRYYHTVLPDETAPLPLDYTHCRKLALGTRVSVPIRNAFVKGTVISHKEHSPFESIKPIQSVLQDEPPIPEELLLLSRRISTYYCTPLAKVIRNILPGPVRKEVKEKRQLLVRSNVPKGQLIRTCRELQRQSPSQAKVSAIMLAHPKGLLLTELLEKAGTSKSPVDTLAKKGILSLASIRVDRTPLEEFEFFRTTPKLLTEEQRSAFDNIRLSIDRSRFLTHLIYGVTGSGKTEIYLQAIEHARSHNLGVILLVPEIALTAQTIERLKSRFTEKLGLFHHRLGDGARFDMWHAVRRGDINIVVGARSAVFAPVKRLGLIVVDEEHDSSYKQMTGQPCYHARDIAVMRGQLSRATVVLGSATPAMESYDNAKKGKYLLSTLTRRASDADLPKVRIIDMKRECEKSSGFRLLSDSLLDGIKKRCEKGEQTLLFLNRRGYNTMQLCTGCGEIVKCTRCDVSLTFHKTDNRLVCHLCRFTIAPAPTGCPYCKKGSCLRYRGAGTEQVQKTLHAILPRVRTLRMDADTTGHRGSHDLLFRSFKSGKADVLIGTQMIAKGLHFPAVTLVGIINADSGLGIPDFRAGEWTFRLLVQVAGRAGRGALEGEVIVQTSLPKHPVLRLAIEGDYTTFFEQEMKTRKPFRYPPFAGLAKITLSGPRPEKTAALGKRVRTALIRELPASCEILPLIPAGLTKTKERFRFQVLIKGERNTLLAKGIRRALQKIGEQNREMKILVDIDSLDMFGTTPEA
ncbi:MAG: primosomal protein N' [Simkaniaceae bacterium]|nr:primosomal protein N' [Simkaniaceae bacterium]